MYFGSYQGAYFGSYYGQAGVIPPVPDIFAPNGGARRDYQPTSYELQNHRRKLEAFKDSEREAELELKAVEYKIEDLEFRRLHDLADENMQLQLIALLKEQQILNQLLLEIQARKEQWRRDDDEILILLMSLPFHA
jgi:hypothetical protein